MKSRRIATLAMTLLCATGAVASAAPASAAAPTADRSMSAQAFGWCDGRNPNGHTDAKTVRTNGAGAALVELRFSPSARCAWGRVTGGVGSEIWTDRSFNGGATWQGMLGYAKVNSGTTNFSLEYDDAGVVMRACGTIWAGAPIQCTAWY
ncbi:hypothetical protein [Catellatospora methionotrophica]|uniref:hypothetical protein n=1 Tax=Catellatospora methionotrophica TaxID=121620 RepID=UPI0033D663DE